MEYDIGIRKEDANLDPLRGTLLYLEVGQWQCSPALYINNAFLYWPSRSTDKLNSCYHRRAPPSVQDKRGVDLSNLCFSNCYLLPTTFHFCTWPLLVARCTSFLARCSLLVASCVTILKPLSTLVTGHSDIITKLYHLPPMSAGADCALTNQEALSDPSSGTCSQPLHL